MRRGLHWVETERSEKMEPPNSSSLGAIGSLLRKLDELLCTEDRAQGLIGGLRKISTNLEKLSEVNDPPLTVKYWMDDARELSYDMEACVDQFVHASQPEAVSAKVAWILAWIREILGFTARVKEVNERCDRFNLVNRYIHNSSPKKVVVNHQLQTMHEEPVDPIGMEDPTNKLLEWLKPKGHGEDDLSLKVVSVLGDEGVGKSTLLKRIWRASEGTFDCRAFVQTAKRTDVRMILRSLLSQVRPKQAPKASKVPKLIDELREVLQYKRYFIVIDGLWDVSLWHIVRRALRGGNHRIVVTTAVENVAQACCRCDPDNIVNVRRLGDDLSKKLFVDTVFGFEKGCPPQFNDVTNEIIRKCGGLPLAIICTSRLAASPHGTEQEQQLHYVNSSLPNNLGTHSSYMEILDKVLKLCFSSLPLRLKTCLLYLSVYPETYLFLKEDLVNQWIAEDFICTPEGKDIVHVAGCYFDELLNLGLIQRMDIINTNKKGLLSYTVHPAVLNFISCKSMEDNFITIIDYSQSTAVLTQKVRRLSLQFGSAAYAATPETVELSRVRSLAFMGLLSCMPLIAEFKLVRVVILNVFIEDGETKFSLSEISKLLQLRYLQVRCNVAVELPKEMQCLKHLETLEINARVEYAPSDIIHVSSLLHVRLGGKTTNPTLGPIASVKAVSSVGSSSVPSPLVYLRRFQLLPPICIFQRLPKWIRHLHKLYNLEIMIRRLWPKDIDALAELPLLTHLSLYVRVPTAPKIIFSRGMFSSLEYFKFVSGVLLLGFQKETMPKLRRLKLGFNAHKGKTYANMLAGIEHLLNLQIITASIGAAPDADESDRRAAEFALKDAIKTHPCHRTFKEAKRVDRVDEEFDFGMMPARTLAHTRCNVAVELPKEMQCLKHLETLEINARVEYAPSDIIHVSSLLHVRLGGKTTNPTLGPIASVKAVSSVGSSSVPSPLVYLRRFQLLPPICIFQRLPKWIRHLHKLYNLEIMIRRLWPKDIDALAELPLLTHLSLYVRVPTAPKIIFSRGMFSSLDGVLLLGFQKETMPKLRRLKLGFNAHKGKTYANMLAGIEHLLNLQIITASIGAAPDADESDRRAAEFALKDAIKTHPCHRTFKEAKRVDRVDEEFDSGMMPARTLAHT
ncbi:hypothetical protein U9M48_001816, partial [Paspalum notatum var. saurae]